MRLEQVADMMGLCEFDLFRQAYAASHDDAPNDEVVGQIFMDYVGDGVVPVWVSAFAKNVVDNCKVYSPVQRVA